MTSRFWFLTYNLILLPLLSGIVKIFASFNSKLSESIEKRKGLWERLEVAVSKRNWQKPLLWFHVASAGELLQAQPLISRCIAEGAECVLTYSSINAFHWIQRPDQTETQNLLAAEFLPVDKIRNVYRLLALIQPSRLVWVSYDLWPNLVWETYRQGIPQSLVCGIIHTGSLRTTFFVGRSFYRSLYECLEQILTVSEADSKRVRSAIPDHPYVKVMGDTRCDSVLERREKFEIPQLPAAAKDRFVFVAGSTWPQDESCIFSGLQDALNKFSELFLVIAPHEPTEERLRNAETFFAGTPMVRWSQVDTATLDVRILLIDSVGILAGIYHSTKMAFIGGAFTTGVHNILEPAAMGATVAFGPKHSNSMEALIMLEQKLATSIKNSSEFQNWLFDLLGDQELCVQLGSKSKKIVETQAGAAKLCTPLLMAGLS